MSRFFRNGGARRRTVEIAAAAVVTVLPSLAHAHFNLQQPPNWTTETSQGSPQKDWPCGNEGSPAPMATGPTTAFKAGDKITITLAETVMHPGYYRVAIAPSGNMMDLPQDMSADASGGNCQNDDKTATPVFPILADGMLNHTTTLSGAQSFEVTLPSDLSCDKCVLQVREYMEMHGNQPETTSGQAAHMNGCYYHHCAFISVSGGSSGAGGMSSSGGAPSAGAGGTSSGGMPGLGGMGGMSMGGAMGEAGSLMSAGGATGTAGGANGGMSGTGAAGMPGASGASAGKGGGTTGTGGTTSNAGATGTGGTGATAGTGTSGAPSSTSGGMNGEAPPNTSDNGKSGCGCRVPARGGSGSLGVVALGFGLWLARRRRR
jgi:hypothetical protein